MDITEQRGLNEVMDILRKAADELESKRGASSLLQRGSDPNLPILNMADNDGLESDVNKHGPTSLAEACRIRDASLVDLLIRFGARDDNNKALQIATKNGDNHLVSKLLALKSFPDPEYKINKKAFEFIPSRSVSALGTVTFSSMFPTTPVMINWHSLKCLPVVERQWIVDASISHNIKLKLNVNSQTSSLIAITRLDLSNNKLTRLPLCIFQLPSLKILNLAQNLLEIVPEHDSDEQFGSLSSTSKMKKSKSFAASLSSSNNSSNNSSSSDFGWCLPALEELYLQDNRLESIPGSVFQLPSLQLLDLSNNKLLNVPQSVWTAPKLRELNLSLNLLRDLPKGPNSGLGTSYTTKSTCSTPESCKDLDSPGKPSSKGSKEVSKDLSDPNLKQMPVKHLNYWSSSVEVVTVSCLDEEFEKSHQCKLLSLNLSHNGFTSVPESLSCLAVNLTRLNLSYNCLSSMGSLKLYPSNLKHLDLSHNQITSWFTVNIGSDSSPSSPSTCYNSILSSDISLAKSTPLTCPKGFKNYCMHKQHSRLDNLRTLIVSNNQLTSICISDNNVFEELEMLENQELKLKSTRILYPNCSMLDLSNNMLKEVPSFIADLSNLSVLNLSGNPEIYQLPPEMGLLSKLWNLRTKGCNLQEPLKTMLDSKKYKTMDIIGYLKSILEDSKPYARMKLMVVGVQGIGKTSLLEQLRMEGTGSYRKKPPEHWAKRMGNKNVNIKTPKGVTLSTVGVDVCDWTYERKERGKTFFGPVSFRTWDFGGQKEYYATHQYFLSKRSLYLVVWKMIDGEKGVDTIQQWLVNIQARAPNSPVIIIGTHYDLMREYFPRFYCEDLQLLIREKFINVIDPDKCGLPRVIDSIEISTKTRHNIKALCNLIYDTVFDIRCPGTKERLLEQKIPATYLALEDVVGYLALERRLQGKDPVLRAEKYKSMVMEEMRARFNTSFRDVAELHQATAFLHDNGLLLHYDDATLKDLYFLDPQWLCDLLAHIVTIREINPYAKNGIMKTEDLKLLFKSSTASSDARAYIVNLLNKFEVALTWDSRTLLIPSLLPKEEQLQAGMPGCDVRIPVRSRGWALRNSYLPPTQPSVDSTANGDISQEITTSVVDRPSMSVYRLVLMAYFPSGFWSRLMTRVLADDIIIEIVRSYFVIPKLAQNNPAIVQFFNQKAEWMCWQTGMALRHSDTVVFRAKEIIPSVVNHPFDYSQSPKFLVQQEGTWSDVEIHKTSVLEIYLPNQVIHIDASTDDGTLTTYIVEPNQECIAKLLALTVDHIDTLLEDWYPSLGTRFVHTSEGKFLVTRLVPCIKCLTHHGAFSSPSESPHRQRAASSPSSSSSSQVFDFTKPKASSSDCSGNAIGSINSTASNDSGVGNESSCSSPKRSVDGARKLDTPQSDVQDHVVYCLLVEECIYKASQQQNIDCVVHGPLRLKKIAPDTVFADLGEQYLIKSDCIKRGKMLGRGAFGFVFRASVKQKGSNNVVDVAMKMLQPVDPGHGAKHSDTVAYKAAWNKWQRDPMQYFCKAYCTARQELNILLTLRHPHIVPLVGVCSNPLALILRLAPMGALDTIIKDYRRSGVKFHSLVLQKVFLQVAKALEYLHQQHIIYRDLKSENVLVWSIPPPYASPKIYFNSDVKVDVKLADYGISRSTLPSGTKGFGGTEGFMAPEIMRYNGEEEYTEKVDCFSFSMFMYELISLHLPFEGQECVKDHVLEGGRPTLTPRDIVYPSHILDLMTLCWSHLPKDRPNASQIVSILSAPEFIHMLDAVFLNETNSFLCGTILPSIKREKVFETWLSRSGKQVDLLSCSETCFLDYSSILSLKQITVTALCYVPNSGIWLGDSNALIYIYSTKTYNELNSFRLDPDDETPTAVNGIRYVPAYDYIAISSTNGRIWLCQKETLHLREIGNNGNPFLCLAVFDVGKNCSELWCGQTEGTISIFTITDMIITSQEVLCLYNDDKYTPVIERLDVYELVAEMPYVWSYLCTGSFVYQWSVTDKVCVRKLDCSKLVPCSESLMSISIEDHLGFAKSQISAMAVYQNELYVGTTGGCLIIVEAASMRPITVFRPYEDEIKAILPFTLRLTTTESDGGDCGPQTPTTTQQQQQQQQSLSQPQPIESKYFVTVGKGFRSLISRYVNLSDDNHGLTLTTQKGIFSILWKSGNWFI